jgi:hypothetical protein
VSLDITDNPVVEFTRVLDLCIQGVAAASYGVQMDLGFEFLYESKQQPPPPEPCVISVRVLDAETNLGVKGAKVNLLTGEGEIVDTATTDSNGFAQLNGVQQTSYVIQVIASGYEKMEKGIDTGWAPELSVTIKIVKIPPPWYWGYLPYIIGGLVVLGLILYFARGRITGIPTYIIEKVRGE